MADKYAEILKKVMPVQHAKGVKKTAQKRRAKKRKANRVTHNKILRKTIKFLNGDSKSKFNDFYFYPDKELRKIINTYIAAVIHELAEGNEVNIPNLGKLRIEVKAAQPKGEGGTSGKQQGKYDAQMYAIAVDSLKQLAKATYDLKESEKKWVKESKKYPKKKQDLNQDSNAHQMGSTSVWLDNPELPI